MYRTLIAAALAMAVGAGLQLCAVASAADQPASEAADYTAHCANCHGDKLQGGVHAAPLSGPVFEQNWAGKRARLLYSRIISTMPQNDPGTLTAQQALSITLYVLARNGIGFAGHSITSPNDLNTLTIAHGASSSTPASNSPR